MRTFSRGFAAPGAVIFLAIIGIVAWYRNQPHATSTPTSTPAAHVRIAGEDRAPSVR